MRKSFDDLTIADDFMFCKVMQDKSICTTVLNMILADSIGPISDISYQKTFDQAGYAKSIRLDVWVTGSDGSVYDVEMQTTNKQDLAKRLRYYQSVIDVSSLEKGGHYTDLHDLFIIFFCPFDYPSKGLPVYTFKTICSENNTIVLQDGITKVIINSTSADKTPDSELKAFLEYMNGITSDNPFIRKVDRYIKELKENEERRKEYMLIQAFEMDARRDGIQQGIQQGIRQGIEQGFSDGSYQTKLETARILKQLGDSVKKIMQATGLSQEEVEAIN